MDFFLSVTFILLSLKKYFFLLLQCCSLYRSVLEPTLSFGPDGQPSPGPSAVFTSLPQSPLFTLNLDVPHSWMVQSVYSPYDLDNIHMASVEREVYAEYELEYILVEGMLWHQVNQLMKSSNYKYH